MIYVILGMHKSGTTLVAQMLHRSGINMGSFDMQLDYDAGNQYERQEPQEINKELLKCGDKFSLDVLTPISSYKYHNFNKLKAKADNLIKKMNKKYKDWGFKDPRTCLTYPFWNFVLPKHKLIFIYRSPVEVCAHYQKGIPAILWFYRVKIWWKTLTAWYVYNHECLKHLRLNDACFLAVNYSDVMTSDSAVKRIEDFINIPLSEDCRVKALYRSHMNQGLIFSSIKWIQTVFFSRPIDQLHSSLKDLSTPVL